MNMLDRFRDRAAPFRDVLAFSFKHWARQKPMVAFIAVGVLLMTLADVLLPVYVGRLIDALAPAVQSGTLDRGAALQEAIHALGAMVGLGALMLVTRHLAFTGVCRMTLVQMVDVAREAFWKVQRFAAEWHANTFAGSIVRKVTRGMWAIDLLNDTLLLALLPSFVVLVGSTVLLGYYWPLMGLVVTVGALDLHRHDGVPLHRLYRARRRGSPTSGTPRPAARWPTRSPAIPWSSRSARSRARTRGCSSVMGKWKKRTYRTWMRHTYSSTGQILSLIILRTAVIGLALYAVVDRPGQRRRRRLRDDGLCRDPGLPARRRHVYPRSAEFGERHGGAGRDPRPAARRRGPRRAPQPIAHPPRPHRVRGRHLPLPRPSPAPLYQGLSVTIGAGEKVGLVGLSGSGKTTFVKLIQRLHDVNGGRILIDGHDIAQRDAGVPARADRDRAAGADPVPPLAGGEHRLWQARRDAGEIERAARLANAHDFIAQLPKGYGTLVGERGVKLSGGERQRVALARAFLADAPILILDEATSSLDSESEALIQEAIERLMQGRTTIVIAHRLSTVRALDRILVFDRGRIVEEGDHGALIGREKGVYRRLFDRQVGGLLVEAG